MRGSKGRVRTDHDVVIKPQAWEGDFVCCSCGVIFAGRTAQEAYDHYLNHVREVTWEPPVAVVGEMPVHQLRDLIAAEVCRTIEAMTRTREVKEFK